MKKTISVTGPRGTRLGLIMVIFESTNCNRIDVYVNTLKRDSARVSDAKLFDKVQSMEDELRRYLKDLMNEAIESSELIHQLKELGFE